MASTHQAIGKQAQGAEQVLARLQMFWASRSQQQRIYLVAGVAVMIAVAVFFGQMLSTPEYKPLMTGMEAADAQAVAAQLAAKKIAYQLSPDGTSISVPADQVDAARLEVASHDTPHSGRIGYEIFDKVSWGQTEFDEKVNYQRALEGELERTIQTMSNVKSVRVHLVMATDSVFMERERGAKASVTLRLRRGSLSRDEAAAITRLVAGAVDELKPEDVALVDADSSESLGSSSTNVAGGNGDVEQDLTRRLVATLTPVVGADHVHATVNVDYETSSSEENEEKYDPAVSVPLNMQRSEENIAAAKAAGGIPGTSSNVSHAGKAATLPVASDPGQSSKTESATYAVNRTTRHVVDPAGRIRRLTAAVLVDDAIEHRQEGGKWIESHHSRSPEELKVIGDLAQAAIGFDSARGDVISVRNLAFDHRPVDDAPLPTLMERAQKNLNGYATVARYGALLALFGMIYLLMFRPIQKRAFAGPDAAQFALASGIGDDPPALPELAGNATQRALMLKKQLAEFVKDEPDTSTTVVRAWLQEGAK